jgi:hypothetical protein
MAACPEHLQGAMKAKRLNTGRESHGKRRSTPARTILVNDLSGAVVVRWSALLVHGSFEEDIAIVGENGDNLGRMFLGAS